MFKLGVVVAAATIAVGMFSLSTDASARVGGRMGGGGAAHFWGRRTFPRRNGQFRRWAAFRRSPLR
jgi:hypothetical protein